MRTDLKFPAVALLVPFLSQPITKRHISLQQVICGWIESDLIEWMRVVQWAVVGRMRLVKRNKQHERVVTMLFDKFTGIRLEKLRF